MIETIKGAMKKMPNAKYIWLHPDDLKEVKYFLDTTGLQVEERYIITKGEFLLTENDLKVEIDNAKGSIIYGKDVLLEIKIEGEWYPVTENNPINEPDIDRKN